MNNKQTSVNQGVKMFFGFFMVLVYLGMAVLMAINFFDWSTTPLWNAVRWFFAVLFVVYGIYRGYREITGAHTYGMRVNDDQEEEYSTYSKKQIEVDRDNEKE